MWPAEYSDLDFDLPEDLIARHPAEPADSARLMVIRRSDQSITHSHFSRLGEYLTAGDNIFYNATRVEERRTYLQKPGSDKQFECVFLKKVAPVALGAPLSGELITGADTGEIWQVLMRNIRRLKDGAKLLAAKDQSYEFILSRNSGQIFLTTRRQLSAEDFARIGEMPLPPYLRRSATAKDSETYQNFFARQLNAAEKILGSAAAPTAALHFTGELYSRLAAQGVKFHPLCLDIGYGTFAPLTEQNFQTGKLHAEHFFIPPETAAAFQLKEPQRKLVLGTTALRALLTYARTGVSEGETEIFIRGNEVIGEIDGLITNFHLPRSSLLLLVSAFAGCKFLGRAYREAVERKYRFYSYGDAMLIL